ncbi:acyl-CoA synthetase (AMP-forming)/AMP-acid ligase II [Kitasatospora sp. MAA4]|uniref:long-chain-fatty-acid--CoA ligase n=1 Tax=Kitasatospora sp. MAA4 TaxID=3035093 RepID=UPI002476AA06|nr:long-chain-fatty-acid--CoA ligase [Kitasatospora sp. MAA4]MDH6135466.1 acyl-CoA synthetase (AMP-forming)/AMP-acid ligase II [Kitasatospora sp. MAA4]
MAIQDSATITARLRRHAAERPEHPAIICEGRQVTYAQLHRASNRTAQALRAAGLTPGTRVAYLGRESEHYYDIVLGALKAGVVLVPINWRLTAREIDHVLRDSGARLLFVESRFRAAVDRIREELPGLAEIVQLDAAEGPVAGFLAWKAGASDTDPELAAHTDDAILQMYTSGTTGLPKGVVLAHRTYFTFQANMARAGLDWIDWLPQDVALVTFPGLHSGGMAWFMFGLVAGSTNVVMPMFIPEEAVRLIREHRVTTTFCAPAMLQMMLDEPAAGPEAFASLRKVTYGGAPMPALLMRRFIAEFGCELAQMYASAETGSVVTCLTSAEHVPGGPKAMSAGRVCPGNEVRILDGEGRPLPQGEIGQISVRSPAHFVEYWGNPKATEQVLHDGWLDMPDAGYLDEDGYLFVCDRINDMIIVAGQNIYPVEVENAVRAAAPAVADVAVVGVTDERWGEIAKAVVVLRPGHELTGREIMVALRGRIADFKIPTKYEFVESLPRNPTGKVLRRELRDPIRPDLTPSS